MYWMTTFKERKRFLATVETNRENMLPQREFLKQITQRTPLSKGSDLKNNLRFIFREGHCRQS